MDLDEETQKSVPVSFELPLNETRSDFTNLFPNGQINWGNKNKVEYIYVTIPDRHLYYDDEKKYTVIIGELFELKAEVDGIEEKLVFNGMIPQNLLWEDRWLYLYYFGNNGQGLEGTNVTNIYDDVKPEYLIGKKITFDKQNGSSEDLGDYHVASVFVTTKEYKDENGEISGYGLIPYFSTDFFKSEMAVAMLDLEGETTLRGSAAQMKSITLKWSNNKEFLLSCERDPNATIDVSDNVGKKSLIALLPTDVTSTLECGKGRYYFPGGVKRNKIYVGKNGYTFESVQPLEWE